MSTLSSTEKSKIKKLLELQKGAGYVFDFSDMRFQEFMDEKVGIDIDDDKYKSLGTSKGKRLRSFWEQASDDLAGKVILVLLEYRKTQELVDEREIDQVEQTLYEACSEIAERLIQAAMVEDILPEKAAIAIETMQTISILLLSADPSDASRLRIGEESREIQEKLKLARFREKFKIDQRMSVRPADISQALLDMQPHIVHFSGHGSVNGDLCFETQTGEIHPIMPDALAALFEQFTEQVNCVLLNSCYSEAQAIAIGKYIDYVIGMNQAIGDHAAIAFATGFYQALGAGRTIEQSYKLGCVQIRLKGIPEHLTPVLIKSGKILAEATV